MRIKNVGALPIHLLWPPSWQTPTWPRFLISNSTQIYSFSTHEFMLLSLFTLYFFFKSLILSPKYALWLPKRMFLKYWSPAPIPNQLNHIFWGWGLAKSILKAPEAIVVCNQSWKLLSLNESCLYLIHFQVWWENHLYQNPIGRYSKLYSR